MHKAPTHASRLLMTGPYADTLTAMSNYFKYTGVGQKWADLCVGGGGGREWGRRDRGRGALRERERCRTGGKKSKVQPVSFLDFLNSLSF